MTHNHEHEHGHQHEQHKNNGSCCNDDNHHSHGCNCCSDSNEETEEMNWWKPVLSLSMLIIGIVMSAMDVHWFQNGWIKLAWYAIAWLPTGWGVLLEAVEGAREGELFSEFLLMTIASLGAFVIGEYPEAVAVMTLYCIGEALQDRAVSRARGNIKSLIAFRPDHAVVVRGDSREIVNPAQVKVGDIVEVKAGERVPVDGSLLGEAAPLDTAALTGESVPRVIECGGDVLAGMISIEQTIQLRVTRPSSESAISRVLTMVEEATERKAPAELYIRRFARVYTPIVVCLAVLVVLLPWLYSLVSPSFSYSLSDWLHRALIFLVISCPCALVISVPLSYFAGIGAASRRGILFKGSNFMDVIAAVEAVVFDKTGTLTTGRFAVDAVENLSDAQMATVAAIESNSPHPIARAIIDYHQADGQLPTTVKSIAGYGMSATVNGQSWLVGTTRLLEREGIPYPESLHDKTGTMVAVAIDGQYVGHILLKDVIKQDAVHAISALKRQGINTIMLSGDRQPIVNETASQLGMEHAAGDLLPQDKVEHIRRLKGEGKQVAFVGDGINDAPVLASSDVGIAMGAMGSDMAIETADIVIQTDQPSRVADAISLGRRTRSIVKQNIAFAIGVKLLVMVLGVLGIANLWEAVFADVGVALLCVLNSLRLMANRGTNAV